MPRISYCMFFFCPVWLENGKYKFGVSTYGFKIQNEDFSFKIPMNPHFPKRLSEQVTIEPYTLAY